MLLVNVAATVASVAADGPLLPTVMVISTGSPAASA